MQYLSSSEEAEARGIPPACAVMCRRHAFDAEKSTLSTKAEAPIGVFDSGVGGLTILSSLCQELPHEHYIYLGDTAHCPYGTRSDSEISQLAVQANRFLIEQGVKLIVVACNTASQAALATLRSTFTVPFVGVVPAVKPAARTTRRGRIGVVATNNAVKAAYLRQLIDDFADNLQVYTIGCPELVALVEHGQLDGPPVEEMLQHVLQPLRAEHIDVLVLGCTHFPALRPAIERVMGKHVQVIDSGAAVARRAHTVLEAEQIIRPANQHDGGNLQLWCSGDEFTFSNVASKILGYPVIAYHATL
ncbi:MAG: glutamate racemase [Ktedonobacteraceae bacterium]|nr:glutamate racemase [Ktedonobacteraceae bacterium]